MDEKLRQHADALYVRAFHNLMAEREKKIRSVLAAMNKRGMGIGTSGIAFGAMREVHVDFVGEDMLARLDSFQQAFKDANVTPESADFAELWCVIEDVYRRGLSSAARILERYSQQGRAGIARVEEDSGDVARQHDRVLREFNVWRSQADLDASERISANEQVSPGGKLVRWAGGAKLLTAAIAFTDVVSSTELCNDLADASWNEIRQQHLARVESLILEQNGILIKNTGDGALTLFHNAIDAVYFALALLADSGHPLVRVRIGIQVGQVCIDGGDISGREVNLASRVMGCAKDGGVVVTNRAKEDFEQWAKPGVSKISWIALPNADLKGFDQPFTLWRMEVLAG